MVRAWVAMLLLGLTACPSVEHTSPCSEDAAGPPAIAYGTRRPSSDYSEYFVVWPRQVGATEKLLEGTWMSPDGGPPYASARRLSSDDRVSCDRPAVAYGNGVAGDREPFVAVWNTGNSGTCGIGSQNGGSFSCSGFAGSRPAIASAGDSLFVVWPEGGAIRGSVVDTFPTTLHTPTGLALVAASSANDPDIACTATNCLVVWQNGTAGILAERITSTGTVIDTSPLVLSTTAIANSPRVTVDGTSYVVVWQESLITSIYSIASALVHDNGTVQSQGFTIAGDLEAPPGPALASNGTDTMIVWSAPEGVRGRLVAGNLEPVTGTIAIADDDSPIVRSPAIASDGDGFLVVWVDASARVNSVPIDGGGRVRRPDFYSQGCAAGGGGPWLPALALALLTVSRRSRTRATRRGRRAATGP